MNRSVWIRRLYLAILALPVLAAGVRAEVPFTVMAEQPQRSLDTSGFTTYEIHVTNTTGDSIGVRATRLTVDVPDTAWHTSICSINTCYPEEISVTPPEKVDPNGMTGFTLHVTAGRSYGQTGRFVIRLDTGPGTEYIDIPFVVQVAPPSAPLFRVEPERVSAATSPGVPVIFDTYVHNLLSDTLELRVVRVEDYFPDATWQSSICVEDSCYAAEIAQPLPLVVSGAHAALFRLRVTGSTPGQGRVVLRFNTSRGTDPLEKRYTVTITPSGVRTIVPELIPSEPPYPNPAVRTLYIPLPAGLGQSHNPTLLFYRTDGSRVADRSVELARALRSGDETLMVTLDGFDEGTYLYTLSTDRESTTGRFQVVR